MRLLKLLRTVLRVLWWALAAAIPVVQYRFHDSYRRAIGCPASGDCYVPGAELLLDMQLLAAGSAVVLWPLCAWYAIVKPWRARRASPGEAGGPLRRRLRVSPTPESPSLTNQ